MLSLRKLASVATILLFGGLGLWWRFYHIEFGLPHSFYADEPEVAELAIKYTYDFKSIIANKNYQEFIPISYVYGTVPTYFLTALVMVYNKVSDITQKMDLYVFMRSINALISFGVCIVYAILAHRVFKGSKQPFGVSLLTFALLALNWKLIVHAHYVNQDIFLTLLLGISFVFLNEGYTNKNDNLLTSFAGVFFGLAVGTKITALISLPLFFYVYFKKNSVTSLLGFLFTSIAAFMATNPFSIVFIQDFAFRIAKMLWVEGGLVFDSVDHSPYKYLVGLSFMTTLPILVFSLYGKLKTLKATDKTTRVIHIFMTLNILVYFAFYSIQSRRVDRWLLPILPIVIMYAAYGIVHLIQDSKKAVRNFGVIAVVLTAGYYLQNTILLLAQFQRNTPKSEAYIWAKDNLPELAPVLVYTEEGLDPMNKLKGGDVKQFQVYESKGASLFYPENPERYDYVILSSRPLENFRKSIVATTYPEYAKAWKNFELLVSDPSKFSLINSFVLPKPNLIPLSDVYIYKRL
ncbi:hypothetical protein A3K34_04730 [candidate division WWE3 bacterium RIFOXYC1_FULL_40_10]|uniref:Glycosyltransferase RgtA/B/C/D-like domain-containing protein n=1 Tax=candidate division WWE3 bacterium RIFOXYA2_FULL_46_9 TaxID=1802636 RepID=A0A1F4W170_UNCKA|nr:MAG: hypothetical protein A3K58_04730 [candidate division WWE3 bacterium RIFOXYB1_FULL_40_22]OGC62143.1 MAG: hypothetical protein A3K37_04730 [candidate division WWE3 bacterium RIFOXYA1_FULL_40_11]OGC63156.1 MAG: hypothetical protein A2264_00475 [candidate division WWE3 bacterium RIFOXYA2_FULL_46_9]OGC64479.1 MAG: hypothetical protein A2326_04020 [candidate division WWE3 bacterium RIFOXYB2_FULL_41_6]OGC66526.1 MAG: hypothetical protein A3K34_04730 [candidate division WWE3 bacterium RIFOXYC1_